MPKISIIVPCYFNAENLPVTVPVLYDAEKLYPPGTRFEYIFVDDGSGDATFSRLIEIRKARPRDVKIVKLSRNFGANSACFAGMHYATGDCNVIIAADLQDPPELVPELFQHWLKGYKLVLANRANRDEPLLQTTISNFFHRLMKYFALTNTPSGGFDLVVFDKQIRDLVIKMDEKNAYLPYLFLWTGFEYVSVPYTRRKREIGKSRWTLKKKIKASIDCFVAFSFAPIRTLSVIGIFLGILALGYTVVILSHSLMEKNPVPGWSSLMVVVLVTACFQMIGLGVLGEYLWRTLEIGRNRPNFIVDQIHEEIENTG